MTRATGRAGGAAVLAFYLRVSIADYSVLVAKELTAS
jgi:hypothetical protein